MIRNPEFLDHLAYAVITKHYSRPNAEHFVTGL